MIKFLGKIPKKIVLACSGGSDSMAILNFLTKGGRDIEVAHINHRTKHGFEASQFVEKFCWNNGIKFHCSLVATERPAKTSLEEFWRNERYKFLENFSDPIITAHHLDDAIETWLFTAMHGEARLIPYSRDNIIRPFLITTKNDLDDWCKRHSIPFIKDPSNLDVKHPRNRIRNIIMKDVLEINKGIHKVIRKKYLNINTQKESQNDSR